MSPISEEELHKVLTDHIARKRANNASASRLLRLLPELKTYIMTFLRSCPNDLVRVAMTCKDLHEHALPVLYNRIVVPIATSLALKHYSMLGRKNPGVDFIRHVELIIPSRDGKLRLREAIKTVIESFPPHMLQSLRSTRIGPMRFSGFMRLCMTQKNLHNLEILGFHDHADRAVWLDAGPSLVMPKVEEIKIHCDQAHAVQACTVAQHFLSTVPGVKILDYKPMDPLMDGFAAQLNDTETGAGSITSALFRNQLLPSIDTKKLRLTRLNLEFADITNWDHSFLKAIDFQVMQELTLISCRGSSKALTKLATHAATNPLSLQRFVFNPRRTINASSLNHFLLSFIGLKTLIIAIGHAPKFVSAEAIGNHGATLSELLMAHNFGYDDFVDHLYCDLDNFASIAKCCPELRQLAMLFPIAVGGQAWDQDYGAYMKQIEDHAPKLANLMIHEPYYDIGYPGNFEDDIPDTATRLASYTFRSVPQLKTLSFGHAGSLIFEFSEYKHFLRGEQKKPNGVKVLASPVTMDKLQLLMGQDSGLLTMTERLLGSDDFEDDPVDDE